MFHFDILLLRLFGGIRWNGPMLTLLKEGRLFIKRLLPLYPSLYPPSTLEQITVTGLCSHPKMCRNKEGVGDLKTSFRLSFNSTPFQSPALKRSPQNLLICF
ncbi:hypothetical protein XELAEV_18013317mg [Xenopus laevis]|uniref:Uncharacterized protein n=1 Tax=Xenopus laevis TaxID=8355 RepID=A0A974HZ23_XENLA|nr:hypothetical protein XELAEV_18013317mg [Xenopus laevis]